MWTMHDLERMLSRLGTIAEFWITTGPEPWEINLILKFGDDIQPDDRYVIVKAVLETVDAGRSVNTMFTVEDFDLIKESLLP